MSSVSTETVAHNRVLGFSMGLSLSPQLYQKALVVSEIGRLAISTDFPIPEVGDDEVMIRNHFVGLNPIDWKSVELNFCLPKFPWVCGREMAGVIVHQGRQVTEFDPGDRVWTSTYYKDIRAGCFQEYVVVPAHTVYRIPRTIPFEAGACLGVPALTAAMTLWKWLGIPLPWKSTACGKRPWLLIWGGSSVTGQFATQFAALSHINVITVTSAETRALSERLGASHVVVRDGKTDEEMVREIKAKTSGLITLAIDLVGPETAKLVLDAVSHEEPVSFAPLVMSPAASLIPSNVQVHTVEMKQFVLDKSNACYGESVQRLFEERKIQLPNMTIIKGGLEAIAPALEVLRRGKLSGRKLIVQVS